MKRFTTGLLAGLAAVFALLALLGASRTLPWGDAWLVSCLVGLPALGCCACVTSLFLGSSARGNLIVLGISSLAAAYVGEALLHLRPAAMPGAEWVEHQQRSVARQRGHAFDERDAHAVMVDLRSQGIDAWPFISASQLLGEPFRGRTVEVTVGGEPIFPLTGISNARIDHCRETGRYPPQRSDEYGFSNPSGMWSGPVEVALIGDSFVHGMCTDADSAIVSRFREGVPATLGVGIGGWGPLFMLGAVREYLSHVQPVHVVWLYYEGNDLVNLRDEYQHPILRSYPTPGFGQSLMQLQSHIDEELKLFVERALAQREEPDPGASVASPGAWQTFGEFVKLYEIRSLLGLTRLAEQHSLFDQVERLRVVLAAAKREIEGWGGSLRFVYLPRYARYSGLSTLQLPQLRAKSRVIGMVNELELPILDMDSVFREEEDPQSLFFYPESHYNEIGNAVVAAELLEWLDVRGGRSSR